MLNELYRYIDTEFMLIVQHDGYLIEHNKFLNLYSELINYDYVGAPWLVNHPAMKLPNGTHKVGNGGFSFRICSKR
jgi:hypothetical protein